MSWKFGSASGGDEIAIRVVLDASAALAQLNNEAGASRVRAYLGESAISAVNVIEAISRLVDEGPDAVSAQAVVTRLGVEVIDFDAHLAVQAGLLRAGTRTLGLSLGARACLALARQLEVPVLTGVQSWKDLDVSVEVLLIR